jgi:lysozyme family protein
MATMELTPALRDEYVGLFEHCTVRPEHAETAKTLAVRIIENKPRYEKVATPLGIPCTLSESSIPWKRRSISRLTCITEIR